MRKMVRLALSLVLSSLAVPAAETSEKFYWQVLEVKARTDEQLRFLHSLQKLSSIQEADFWEMPGVVNGSAHVMVSPTSKVPQLLQLAKLDYVILIKDLERLLKENEAKERRLRSVSLHGRRLRDEEADDAFLPFGQYHDYSSVTKSLRRIAQSSHFAEVVDIGASAEGRRILGLKIGNDDGQKDVMIFDAGIHAREWATIHTALYFIYMLVSSAADPRSIAYREGMVIYVFPIMNPDGYEYTRLNQTDPTKRMWRKNRGRESCQNGRCCKGVDLNRNFDFQFGEIGASRYACSEIYNGPTAFSEPETIALRDFFMFLGSRVRAYITLHAYSQLWIYSYSHRKTTYPKNIADVREVAARAVQEVAKVYGTKYKFGTGPEIIYGFAGGSTDWATEKRRVPYSYTIELRPQYSVWNGFALDPSELIPTARETWAGVKVVLEKVLEEQIIGKASDGGGVAAAIEPANTATASLPPSSCLDASSERSCLSWLKDQSSLCSSNPSTMRRDCARSCKFC